MGRLRLPGSGISIFSSFWDPVGGIPIFLIKIWIPKKIQIPFKIWILKRDPDPESEKESEFPDPDFRDSAHPYCEPLRHFSAF